MTASAATGRDSNGAEQHGDGVDVRKIELVMALRRQGISSERVLSAMETVPRDVFVPEAFARRAYDDSALPIECGQTISQPYVVAYMTEALDVGPRQKVLEIGTGSGYQTAVLAKLCRRVYSIERYRTLLSEAEARFRALDLHNITAKTGDGYKGWPEQAPFDRIIVTAAAQSVPQSLVDQLKIGGIMVIPVGQSSEGQTLLRLKRTEEGVERQSLLPVRFVPLVEGLAREG
jgi:protein-L-isoaspartate(D-aspartate) O-methyltransferase